MNPLKKFEPGFTISEPVYDTEIFKTRSWEAVNQAVNSKETHTQLYISWVTPNWDSDNSIIDEFFREIEDHFWNENNIEIFFGGNNYGTGVSIYYPDNEVYKNRALTENARSLHILKFDIQRQLTQMTQACEPIQFDHNFSMPGYHWPYIMKAVSDQLEGGKIIKKQGCLMIQKDID